MLTVWGGIALGALEAMSKRVCDGSVRAACLRARWGKRWAVHIERRRVATIDNQSVDVALRAACRLERSSVKGSDALGIAEQLPFAAFPANVDVLLRDDVITDACGHRRSI